MTTKDYLVIAAVMRQARSKPLEGQRGYIIRALSEVFENDNPRYKPELFFKACEMTAPDA